MAVRDSADKGYFSICASDACATYTKTRHDNAINAFGGYCVALNSDEVIKKIESIEK